MNILQVQDALKNASDMQLSGELQNPTGMAPSYLVLSEMKRRQQMRQGAMASPAPQSSMAEEAAGQSDYYPEEQPQEEEAGIEAFREGGVVRMAEGGLPVFRPSPLVPSLPSLPSAPRSSSPRLLDAAAAELSLDPSLRSPAMIDNVARQYGIDPADLTERLNNPTPRVSPAQTAPEARSPSPSRPATQASERTAPTETAGGLYGPPAPPAGAAAPRAGASESRGGGAMPSGGGMPSGQPSGQTTDPTIQALYDRLRATGQSREDYRKDAVNTGLMQAGLAMMASKDPNALANLGQGGLRGLESYTQEMRQGRQGERQGIQDEITIRRAQTEEAYRRGIITNQERQLRLAELRMGQASGERSERSADRASQLEEANRLRSEGQMGRLIPAMEGRITRLGDQISAFSMARNTPEGQTPRTRDPSMQGAYDALVAERARLQNRVRNAQDFLIERGGVDLSTLDRPAPTQGAPGLPAGARSTPLLPR